MVSRNFLIQQACLTALEQAMPDTMRIFGPRAAANDAIRILCFSSESHWFIQDVRKHFAILDRREREAADVVRLDTWREASGIK